MTVEEAIEKFNNKMLDLEIAVILHRVLWGIYIPELLTIDNPPFVRCMVDLKIHAIRKMGITKEMIFNNLHDSNYCFLCLFARKYREYHFHNNPDQLQDYCFLCPLMNCPSASPNNCLYGLYHYFRGIYEFRKEPIFECVSAAIRIAELPITNTVYGSKESIEKLDEVIQVDFK